MDPKEHQLQSLGICNRVFNFIMRNLAAHALKPVTLGGHPQMVHPLPLPRDPAASSNDHGRDDGREPPEEVDIAIPASAPPQPKAPKKTVSINDRVEEITDTKKKKKRKQTQKMTSLERKQDEEEGEPKPLKSILKVGSKSYENSSSFVYQSTC